MEKLYKEELALEEVRLLYQKYDADANQINSKASNLLSSSSLIFNSIWRFTNFIIDFQSTDYLRNFGNSLSFVLHRGGMYHLDCPFSSRI